MLSSRAEHNQWEQKVTDQHFQPNEKFMNVGLRVKLNKLAKLVYLFASVK